MVQQTPIEPVPDTNAAFRSTDQNGKSEPGYKVYQVILRQPIGQLYQRVATHKERALSSPMLRTPISAHPYDLATIANIIMACGVLPALREKNQQ
ncbi:hypothetical protein MJO28_009898 [Puccinia striiformis f. sp. tritici]|uniref:Uncharacterized protein n=1 Tax=Puccinia striiformis f. sp. tritici TaxID=168172 RepID=A0ACC0EAK0_9BASI|nr:hypothetical protein MJO28_009898 [Puccinia striiformis f. sp. tritici]